MKWFQFFMNLINKKLHGYRVTMSS